MIVWIVFACLLGVWLTHEATAECRARRRLGKKYEEYVAGAFEPRFDAGPEGTTLVTRIASEVVSEKGRQAVLLEAPTRLDGRPMSTVVHEVNRDGTFASRGPYFISWYARRWSLTGRRHVIRTLIAAGGGGFKVGNPSRGTVPEIGVEVLEWDTAQYQAVSAREYLHQQENKKVVQAPRTPKDRGG